MLARQVADVGWGDFLNKLENKDESAGLRVERVDPKFTSQACSGCGRDSVSWCYHPPLVILARRICVAFKSGAKQTRSP